MGPIIQSECFVEERGTYRMESNRMVVLLIVVLSREARWYGE